MTRADRLAIVAARYLDFAELSWLIYQADLRHDVTAGDTYRQALIMQEEGGEGYAFSAQRRTKTCG